MAVFFLRTTKTKGEATLYFRVQKRNPQVNLMVSTQMCVNIEVWNKANGSAKDWKRFCNTKEGAELNEKLDSIRKAVNDLVNSGVTDKDRIDAAVTDVVFDDVRQMMRKAREEEERIKAIEEERRNKDVMLYMENFLQGIKDGTTKFKGRSYDKNTIKVWSTFQKVLQGFYKKHPFTWDDIDRKFADNFILYLEKKGYMPKTINKHVMNMRALVSYALKDKKHSNTKADELFEKRKVKESDKAKEIYLTNDEIQALYEMPLVGMPAIVRDVFLVGCYTCQRFCDYSTLKSTNFTTTARGTKVVRIEQEKTGNSVVVPVLNDNLLKIAKKYDYNIPSVSDVILNRYIKLILKELSVNVPSLAQTEITKLTMKEIEKEKQGKVEWMRDKDGNVIKHRYDLVSSHTARRSGITNLYLSGRFDMFQMMSVSGHKDQRTFLDYVKLSSDEIADRIASTASNKKAVNAEAF